MRSVFQGAAYEGLSCDALEWIASNGGGQSAACLGGWNLAISEFSQHKPAAIELVKFLTSADAQKQRALNTARLPSIPALYDDPDTREQQPLVAQWKTVFENATPRPSAPTKAKHNEVSQHFWTTANRTLSGQGDGATNLDALERQLRRLKRGEW